MTPDLFGGSPLPEGFVYQAKALTAAEEAVLLTKLESLPFEAFDSTAFLASGGWSRLAGNMTSRRRRCGRLTLCQTFFVPSVIGLRLSRDVFGGERASEMLDG